MNGDVIDVKIKNIRDIEWDNFDTLIIGHTNELRHIVGEGIKDKLIEEALVRRKNVYSYDYLNLPQRLREYEDQLFVPCVRDEDKTPYRYGMLYRIGIPVLAILGTSSVQGKFTLQLSLRKKFMQSGYNVGQIGTEPNSLLFGMDYVVPMGYNSTVSITGNDLIAYLNNVINLLEKKQKDIILVGTQAGTVLYEEGNLSRYNVELYSFLLGTNPDAVVLCVNPYDSIEYIQRTIQFIESSINTKVIALAVFPMSIKEGYFSIHGVKVPLAEDEYIEIKKRFQSIFNRKIIRIGNKSEIDCLFNRIVDYFSE